MRLSSEALGDDGDRQKKKGKPSLIDDDVGFPLTPARLVVGYALTSKKADSFLKPKLLALARQNGILFVAIDIKRPLSSQGPFDVILHKLIGNEWCQALKDYGQEHPNITILDPPDSIRLVQNRQSMLKDVADINLSDRHGKVIVPRQIVILEDPSSIPDKITKEGLKFPLVAKPLIVDGSTKAHEMFLAYDKCSLAKLEPPLVLQEFINHGGVLFKVYIVGELIKVVRRFSLPDVCKREMSKMAGLFPFPRVSGASASADDADLDSIVAELPPRPLLERLARELRSRLGLHLFNVDMIREHGMQDRYYVIDINYFPGFGKVPEYEQIFIDFLLGIERRKREQPQKHNPTS